MVPKKLTVSVLPSTGEPILITLKPNDIESPILVTTCTSSLTRFTQ